MQIRSIKLQLLLMVIIISNDLVYAIRAEGGASFNGNNWQRFSNVWLLDKNTLISQAVTFPMVNNLNGALGFQINMSGDDIVFTDSEVDCISDYGCKVGTSRSKITVRGKELEVFTGSTKVNWMGKPDFIPKDLKIYSLVPTTDAKQNEKYPYTTRSVGFKPSAEIFSYLNDQVSSGWNQAIYFVLKSEYSPQSKFEYFKQKESTKDARINIYLGNKPQLIAGSRDEMRDPGQFLHIKDKKGFWTLDNIKVEFPANNYPEPTTGEACFSDSYKGAIGIKNLADYKKQLFTDACGGPTFEDCKKQFDPSKLPEIKITLLSDKTLIPRYLKGEDYMAWVWNEGKKESKKIDDYVLVLDSFTDTYEDCPPSATIIFGRFFSDKIITTFRAAANGDRMIALDTGTSQFSPMRKPSALEFVLILIFGVYGLMAICGLVSLVWGVMYFVRRHKRQKAFALSQTLMSTG